MRSFDTAQDLRNAKLHIKIQNSKLVLFIILVTGIALRLVNLESWFHFEMDEEVIAWKVREFALTGKPFLIGGSTPYGFHLGPAFYYLSAIPLFFSKLDPIGWGYLSAVVGGIAIVAAYYIGKQIRGERFGLIMSVLWAFSFRQIFFDRHWWPMVLNPLMGLLVVWLWWKIIANKGKKWWLMLGAILAFAWQADLSNLVLFLGTGITGLILLFRNKFKQNSLGPPVGGLGCLVILGISFMPLVFFEMRHPGANLGKIFEYQFAFKQTDNNEIIKSLLLPPQVVGGALVPMAFYDGNLLNFYSWDKTVAGQRTYGQHWSITALGFGLLIFPIAMWFLKKRDIDLALSVLVMSGWIGILIFGLAGGDLFDFYLASLYSIPLMAGALVLNRLMEKRGILGVLGLLGMLGILGINLKIYSKAYHPQGLKIKKDAVEWSISEVGNNSFGLDVLSKNHRYNGMRYLYMLADREPIISYMDNAISWLYDSYGPQKPKKFVAIATDDVSLLNVENNKRFGIFNVMIMDNEKQNYQIIY